MTDKTEACTCEGSGCMQCDPGHNALTHMKWIADGAETLADVISATEAFAASLREQMEAGWQLEEPVGDGFVWLVKPQEVTAK